MVKLHDIAIKAGVSVSAVSRTFTPNCSVSAEKRAKIIAAAKQLGYSRLPADAPNDPVKRIVLDLDAATLSAYPHLFSLLNEIGKKRGIEWILAPQMPSVAFSGLLRIGGASDKALPAHTEGLVSVHCLPETLSATGAVVGMDYRQVGEQAALILLAAGFESFAFVGAGLEEPLSQECYSGFSAVFDRAAQLDWAQIHAKTHTLAAAKEVIGKQIAKKTLARAYFCCSSALAIGTYVTLLEHGIKIPEQCAILHLGNSAEVAESGFCLSTLQTPIENIVQSGIAHLCDLIAEPKSAREQRRLPALLMDRGSLSR